MRHHGYTLIELLVATASSAVLMAGMATTLYISTQSMDIDSGAASEKVRLREVLAQITSDVSHATLFSERSANAMVFCVPDRNGDGAEEVLRYAWGGNSGDPLTLEYNGGEAITLVDDVASLDFTYLDRLVVGSVNEGAGGTASVVFEEFSEAKVEFGDQLQIPSHVAAGVGDLLILAVSLDSAESEDLPNPAGWTALATSDEDEDVAFGVWWRLATDSEPATYDLSLDSFSRAYGWVMRFTGHDPSSPIADTATDRGRSTQPDSPAVTTTVDDSLVLRLIGCDDDDITLDDPGVEAHTSITFDSSGMVASASGGAAYAAQETAGSSGADSFLLTGNEQYVTVTLAISPEVSP